MELASLKCARTATSRVAGWLFYRPLDLQFATPPGHVQTHSRPRQLCGRSITAARVARAVLPCLIFQDLRFGLVRWRMCERSVPADSEMLEWHAKTNWELGISRSRRRCYRGQELRKLWLLGYLVVCNGPRYVHRNMWGWVNPGITMATVACNRGIGRRHGSPFALHSISRKRYIRSACFLSGRQLCLSRVLPFEPAVVRLSQSEHDTAEYHPV